MRSHLGISNDNTMTYYSGEMRTIELSLCISKQTFF